MGKGAGGAGTDVIGAAKETGEQARQLQREQTLANRPNQVNPWGSTEWVQTPIAQPSQQTGGGGGGVGNDYGQGGGLPPGIPPGGTTGPGGGNAPGGGYMDNPGGSIVDLPWDPWGAQQPVTSPVGANKQGNLIMPAPAPTGGTLPQGPGGGVPGGVDIPQQGPITAPGGDLPLSSWTQIERLNPLLQRALDAQFGQQAGRSELAQSLLPQLRESMSQPFDWDKYGDPIGYDPTEQRQAAEDAAYGRATARLDPQFQRQEEALEVQLRNKGLRPGDQAYEAEMDRFNRSRTDAYEQARLGATGEGRAETGLGMQQNQLANMLRQQRMQEDLYARGYTLDEINRLMQGQEIEGSSPSMQEKGTIADILSGQGGPKLF